MKIQRFISRIYGKNFSVKVFILLLLAVAASVTQFWSAYCLGKITDSVTVGKAAVLSGTAEIVAIVMVNFAAAFLVDFSARKMSNRLENVLRKRAAEKICKADYKELSGIREADIFAISVSDVEGIAEWFSFLTAIVQAPVKIFIVFSAVIRIHWLLFICCLVLYPLVMLPSLLLSGKMYELNLKEKEASADCTHFFRESLSFMVVLKSFGMEKFFIRKNQDHLKALERAKRKREKRERLIKALPRCAGSFINPFLFTVAAWSILKGEVTIGQMISMIFYIDIAGESINQLTGIGKQYQNVKACAARLAALLELPGEKGGRSVPVLEETDVVFDVRDVSFSYGKENVLQGISFLIRRGEKVAILGKSGSGKSTLFKLLNGLYAPEAGRILFLGHDMVQWPMENLRKNISVVTQESFIFQDTILNNVRIARPEASIEEVKAACCRALADDFIERLPEGYDTMLGDVVVSLSNGQMQRINLARAFLKNADVWLFDEPTSALDAGLRDEIMADIVNGTGDKTVLCIVHEPELALEFPVCITIRDGRVSSVVRRKKEEEGHV